MEGTPFEDDIDWVKQQPLSDGLFCKRCNKHATILIKGKCWQCLGKKETN